VEAREVQAEVTSGAELQAITSRTVTSEGEPNANSCILGYSCG